MFFPQDNLEFEAITPAVKEEDLEKVVSPLIVEYFEHGDTNEVIVSTFCIQSCPRITAENLRGYISLRLK